MERLTDWAELLLISMVKSKNWFQILSESDGYFSNFGLTPGSYYVMPDTAQLRRLGMTSDPDSIDLM